MFKRLKDHESKPPASLFGKIMEGMHASENDEEEKKWKQLQDHAVAPPPALFQKIRGLKKTNPVIYLRWAAAAAAVLVIGFFIYNLSAGKQTAQTINGFAIVEFDMPHTPAKEDISQQRNIASVPAQQIIRKKTITGLKDTAGNSETIDYLVKGGISSFMECENCQFAVYYSPERKKIVIGVDEYSSAAVSDKMKAFMKAMYNTNRRNKPTAKARRSKRQLERWKKTDAEYFDHSLEKSALDPIDLLEYSVDHKKN